MYSEQTLALSINSFYTELTLKSLHDNIFVTRYPKYNISHLWSHNEKLVIIDQKIAFVGGIDLCWGRYDSNKHPIVEEENEYNAYYYPGCDYINERQVNLHNVEKFYEEQLDRNSMPRMAWHDVHTMVEGPIVGDIVRHFVERWNFARFNERNNGLVTVDTSSDDFDRNKIKNKNNNIEINNTPNLSEISGIKEGENINKDNDILINNKINDKTNNNIISEDCPLNERGASEELVINKNNDDEKNSFTLFDNDKEKAKDNLNKFNDFKKENDKNQKKMELKQKAFLNEDEQLKDQSIDMDFNIQALRSVSLWSIGKKESSILQGYYKLIDNAKHYIYIENQFFITKSFSEEERINSGLKINSIVQNEIGLHIRKRIERAYLEKSKV